MISLVVRLTALTLVCVAFTAEFGPRSSGYDPAEATATLFDSERQSGTDSRYGVQAASIDVSETVDQWSRADAMRQTLAGGVADLGELVSFTSTAYGQDEEPPQSAASGTGGPNGCSATGNDTDEVSQCSTNQDSSAEGGGYDSSCSTADGGGGGGTPTCSAFTGEGGGQNDNVGCSAAAGMGGNNQTCSAGGNTGTSGCSTSGGDSTPGSTDGAVVCSAHGGGQQGSQSHCSAMGGNSSQSCSTHAGEHQACSAGSTGTGNQATCSATGQTTGDDNSASCSVSDSPPEGGHANKCSAIAYGNQPGGTTACSALGNTDGSCSVQADQSGETNNSACTTIPNEQGQFPPGGYGCSAIPVGGQPATGSCSVIGAEGTTPPAGNPPICGGPIDGHDDDDDPDFPVPTPTPSNP